MSCSRVIPGEVLHAGVLEQAPQLALRAKMLEDQRLTLAIAAGPEAAGSTRCRIAGSHPSTWLGSGAGSGSGSGSGSDSGSGSRFGFGLGFGLG